jgi:hypothetical protein
LYISATVAAETNASTPWPLSIAMIIVVLVAYIISPSIEKTDKNFEDVVIHENRNQKKE